MGNQTISEDTFNRIISDSLSREFSYHESEARSSLREQETNDFSRSNYIHITLEIRRLKEIVEVMQRTRPSTDFSQGIRDYKEIIKSLEEKCKEFVEHYNIDTDINVYNPKTDSFTKL